jgi:hypothetical protein
MMKMYKSLDTVDLFVIDRHRRCRWHYWLENQSQASAGGSKERDSTFRGKLASSSARPTCASTEALVPAVMRPRWIRKSLSVMQHMLIGYNYTIGLVWYSRRAGFLSPMTTRSRFPESSGPYTPSVLTRPSLFARKTYSELSHYSHCHVLVSKRSHFHGFHSETTRGLRVG